MLIKHSVTELHPQGVRTTVKTIKQRNKLSPNQISWKHLHKSLPSVKNTAKCILHWKRNKLGISKSFPNETLCDSPVSSFTINIIPDKSKFNFNSQKYIYFFVTEFIFEKYLFQYKF